VSRSTTGRQAKELSSKWASTKAIAAAHGVHPARAKELLVTLEAGGVVERTRGHGSGLTLWRLRKDQQAGGPR
jgi:DNA-binding IscR family transcriptional regulator